LFEWACNAKYKIEVHIQWYTNNNIKIWRFSMQTNAPNFIVWIVAVVIGVVGLLAHFIVIPVASLYSFWLVAIGFAGLALANIIKGR